MALCRACCLSCALCPALAGLHVARTDKGQGADDAAGRPVGIAQRQRDDMLGVVTGQLTTCVPR